MGRCAAALAVCIAALTALVNATGCGDDDDVCMLQRRVEEQERLEKTLIRDMKRHGVGDSDDERSSTAAQVSRMLMNMHVAAAKMSSSASARRVMAGASKRLDSVSKETKDFRYVKGKEEQAEVVASKLQKAAAPLLDVWKVWMEEARGTVPPQMTGLLSSLDKEKSFMATNEFSRYLKEHASKDLLEGPVRKRLQKELAIGRRVLKETVKKMSRGTSLLQTSDAALQPESEFHLHGGEAEWTGDIEQQHDSHVSTNEFDSQSEMEAERRKESKIRDDLKAIQKGRQELEQDDNYLDERSREYKYTEPVVKDKMAAQIKRYVDCMSGLQSNCDSTVNLEGGSCDVFLHLEDVSRAFRICGVHLKTFTQGKNVYVLEDENYDGGMSMGYGLELTWYNRKTATYLYYAPLDFGFCNIAVDNSRLGKGEYELRPANALVVNIYQSRLKMFELRNMGPAVSAAFGGGHPISDSNCIKYTYGYEYCPARADSYGLTIEFTKPVYRELVLGGQSFSFCLAYASTKLSTGKHDTFEICFGRDWAQVWAKGDNIIDADDISDAIGLTIHQNYGEYWEGFASRRGFGISTTLSKMSGDPTKYFSMADVGIGYDAAAPNEYDELPFDACQNASIPWGTNEDGEEIDTGDNSIWGHNDRGWITHDYYTNMFFDIMQDLMHSNLMDVPLAKKDDRKVVSDLERVELVAKNYGSLNRKTLNAVMDHNKLYGWTSHVRGNAMEWAMSKLQGTAGTQYDSVAQQKSSEEERDDAVRTRASYED